MMQTTAWIDEKEIIHYFPIEELSWNPVRRFQQIFEVKSRWRASEIVPFVREISKNQSQVEVMLLKYSRISMIDGEKYYFARACAKS